VFNVQPDRTFVCWTAQESQTASKRRDAHAGRDAEVYRDIGKLDL